VTASELSRAEAYKTALRELAKAVDGLLCQTNEFGDYEAGDKVPSDIYRQYLDKLGEAYSAARDVLGIKRGESVYTPEEIEALLAARKENRK
jgi:hypothetical protein